MKQSIRRIALAIAMALIFAAPVMAQDSRPRYVNLPTPPSQEDVKADKNVLENSPCKVKVRIIAFKWDNPEEYREDFMSPNQMEWWLKEGQKKFPGICIVTEKGVADYGIAWTFTSETTTHSYTVPKEERTRHQGTVNATSTSTGTLGSTNTSGTYSGTSTRTTYETKEYEWTNTYVNAFVHKVVEIEVDGKKQRKTERPPIFIAKHKGQWRWSKPDKDSLKKAMEFINKQLK